MDDHSLLTLEYQKIKNLIQSYAASDLGRDQLEALRPASTLLDMKGRVNLGREFFALALQYGNFPIGDLFDPIPLLESTAQSGQLLEPMELRQIARFLQVAQKVKDFMAQVEGGIAPRVQELCADLFPCADLRSRIELCIDDNGHITDDASHHLRKIRREVKIARTRVKKHLDHYLNSAEYKDVVLENIITLRQDRYVIPLRSNFRGKINGVVQGHSASGSTFYVEPAETVEFNNKVATMLGQEREEEYRIIAEINELLRSRMRALRENVTGLARIDLYSACVRYAIARGGTWLPVTEQRAAVCHALRHPLLGDHAVPVDIQIGHDFHTLLITGPNTGGKTLGLKALGVAVLCHNSGLPVLCSEQSSIGYFDSVYADIGDEQSIEQNLSTFSSHIVNIARMASVAGERSLILLDELGSGTDPEEGGALAVGVLRYFIERKALVVATTHHNAVKRFAYNTPGVENACMEFDFATLQPTYRILFGQQGESSALAIAEKYGLPRTIVNYSREFLNGEMTEGIKTIQALERKLERHVKKDQEFRLKREQLEARLATLEEREQQTKRRSEAILEQATMQAESLLKEARREAEAYVRSMKQSAQHSTSQSATLPSDVRQSRQNFKTVSDKVSADAMKLRLGRLQKLEKLTVGAAVYVQKLDRDGVILAIDGKMVEVNVDGMRIKTTPEALYAPQTPPAPKQKIAKKKSAEEITASYGVTITGLKQELMLVGERVEEGLEMLEKYLAQAIMTDWEYVRIVHGLGSGKLKRAVREYLTKSPSVKEWRDGEAFEGGIGATVVTLKG